MLTSNRPSTITLHPVLLDALALIHPHPRLSDYASRWREQLTKTAVAQASPDKLAFRLERAVAGRRSPSGRICP